MGSDRYRVFQLTEGMVILDKRMVTIIMPTVKLDTMDTYGIMDKAVTPVNLVLISSGLIRIADGHLNPGVTKDTKVKDTEVKVSTVVSRSSTTTLRINDSNTTPTQMRVVPRRGRGGLFHFTGRTTA